MKQASFSEQDARRRESLHARSLKVRIECAAMIGVLRLMHALRWRSGIRPGGWTGSRTRPHRV